jgi:hypothetical protein
MNPTRLLASAAALALALGLAACGSGSEQPTAIETPDPTVEPMPTETDAPAPAEKTFAMPQDCTAILPQTRVSALAAQGITLVGGPGTAIGSTYLPEPTREEAAGGISCFFEDAARPNFAMLTISVAPVSAATRAQIVSGLTEQGLNQGATADNNATFWVLGDEQGRSAVHHVLTGEAWISVVSLFGGEVFYDEAVVLANDVISAVYN